MTAGVKNIGLLRYLGFGLLLAAMFVVSPAWAQWRKMALLIGVNNYPDLAPQDQLKTAVNDADAVAQTLAGIGFDKPVVVHNPNRRQMIDAVYDFSSKLSKGDTAVFYFAGHGVNFGANYYLPSDIPPPRNNTKIEETRLASSAISEKEILQIIAASGAQVTLAIFDACRNNPLNVDGDNSRTLGSRSGLVAERAPPEGVAVLYSASNGQTALDRLYNEDASQPGLNSVFTRLLVKELVVPGQGLRAIADQLKIKVPELAKKNDGHLQRPAYYDELTGDYFLTDKVEVAAAVATAPAIQQTSDPCRDAAAHWQAVSEAGSERLLRDHIERFPSCAFVEIARSRLETAAVTEAPKPAPNDDNRISAESAAACRMHAGPKVEWDELKGDLAKTWCKPAREANPHDPDTAYFYARALNRAEDYSAALAMYETAADLGSGAALSNLGLMYEYGEGVKADIAKANELFERSVELGSPLGMVALGRSYEKGTGKTKDIVRAIRLYEKSAELGNSQALLNLGVIYRDGIGVTANHRKAFKYFNDANGSGSLRATVVLAEAFDKGYGVDKDADQAAFVAENALRRGSVLMARSMKEKADTWSEAFRRNLQQRLQRAGVYPGAADGKFGTGTFQAIDAIFGTEP